MKALVTGASGFLGTHLIDRLVKDGWEVTSLDREMFYSQYVLQEYVEREKPDYIFHLAAYGNHSTHEDAHQMYQVNVINLLALLEATKEYPYKAFINFGSSSEYGYKNYAMHEDDTLETESFYGASKVAATYLCRSHAAKYGKNIITVRPFSVYGPGEAEFRLIPKLINSIETQEYMELDPLPAHDWIYIEDFINGVLFAMKGEEPIVNIGTGIQYSNGEVADTLTRVAGKAPNIKVKFNMRDHDSSIWFADNEVLKNTGWTQTYSLEEGLRETYERITE